MRATSLASLVLVHLFVRVCAYLCVCVRAYVSVCVRVHLRMCVSSRTERDDILTLVSAILHLGDVEFEKNSSSTGDDGSRIKNMAVLEMAATQLRVRGW